jgi:hypothetical protein
MPNGRRFSATARGDSDRAAWRLVKAQMPDLSDQDAQAVVNFWLQQGIIETRSYNDPVTRKTQPGLFVTALSEVAQFT